MSGQMKIQTYKDLETEKQKLEATLRIQKDLIRNDIADLREEFRPVKEALRFVGKFTTKEKSNPAIALGVDVAGDAILKNGLLRKSGWLTRLIVPFLAKNYATHALADKGNNFFQRLASKLKSKSK
jgi:hypothetical protein